MVAGKREKELGSQYSLQGHTPNDLTSFHYTPHLKAPLPPRSARSWWSCL
jgi:hypothetical protein